MSSKNTTPPAAPLPAAQTSTEAISEDLLDSLKAADGDLQALYTEMTAADDPRDYREKVRQTEESYQRARKNLRKASGLLLKYTDELSARFRDLDRKKKRRFLPGPPANAVIDLEEKDRNHFAAGLNLYKLLLLCFIGSFVGVLIELLWCLATRGHLESRAGLVYGPFNLLYGAGAVLLTLSLYRFRNRGRWLSFLGGMLVGSVLEYACSFLQEWLFGSRSWDYSDMPFDLNGRICLLYSLFWGVLGVLWVKNLYPRIAGWILKIPNRPGKIITWLLFAFFLFDGIVTLLALTRWSMRVSGAAPAQSGIWALFDARFPNRRMEKIFANMRF